MKILHTADFHVRDKDIEECRKVLNALCQEAITRNDIDLVVIAGDLTDRNDIKFDSQTARLIMETVKGLSYIAPVVIVTGTKSHDGNIPELMAQVNSYNPVYVANQPEQILLTGDDFVDVHDDIRPHHALISFIPTPTKQFFDTLDGIEATDQAIGEAMSSIFAQFGETAGRLNLPHVIVGHWQVGGAYISETQQLVGRDIEISVDQILSARPSVACLGHIHKAQQIGRHPIFYSGSTYRKDWGEMDTKGFYIHEIDEAGLVTQIPEIDDSEFVELPSRKLIKVSHDYTVKDLDFEMAPLAGGYSDEDIQGAHIRVEFKVWQDQRDRIDKDQLQQILINKGAAAAEIQIVTIPRQNVRAAQVLKSENLRDKVRARAEIVGDEVPESILEKCDEIEAGTREEIVKKIKQAA